MPSEETMIKICRRLEKHIDEYRLHLVDEAHKEERMMSAIDQTTRNVDALVIATSGLIKGWNFVINFQKFVIWLGGFGILAAIINHFIKG